MQEKPTYEELEAKVLELQKAGGKGTISEKKLHESEPWYRVLFKSNPHPMWIYDLDSLAFLDVNNAAVSHYGYSRVEFLSMTLKDIRPPEDVPRLMKNIEKVIDGLDEAGVWRHIKKDGSIIEVEITSHVILYRGRHAEMVLANDITARKVAERVLRQYEYIISTTKDLMSLIDRDYVYKAVNDAYLSAHSKSREEIVGAPVEHIMGTGVFQETVKPYLDQAFDGQTVQYQSWFEYSGLGRRFKEVIYQPFRDNDGRLIGVVECVHDISENMRAETALKESEERTRATFNAIADSVFLHPLLEEGFAPFVDVNDTAVKRYGYTREELLAMKAPDITKRSDVDDHSRPDHRRKLYEAERLVFEATHITKSGEEFPVEINSAIIELGGCPMILAVVRDISDRKEAEEALRVSHERFLTVLNSIDATIYVADLDTHEILFMNKYMIESFKGDHTGEICWKAFRGATSPCEHCANDKLIDGDGNPTGACNWQGENPINKRWYLNYDRAIEWNDGRMVKLQIATDITALKKLEKQLHQSQRLEAIGTLAGGIAHDFNNILMGVQGRISLISMDINSTQPFREHIHAAEDHIRSAKDLTRQLLGLARGGKYEVKATDLNELVLNSVNMFGRTHKELELHTKLHTPPPIAEVDRRQIEQVLLNLFINAWQAMPSGGNLILATEKIILDENESKSFHIKPSRYATVSITDTGIGMDEKVKQRVFDPFFTTKEKGRGTGLGLASAYGIIKNHAGTITVDSSVGHGATFKIYLPLSDENVSQEKQIEEQIAQGSETILLVDDEQMILNVSQAMLSTLGYRVLLAGSGKQALEIVKQKGVEIDLIILDLIMPGLDGGQVFDSLKVMQTDIPVILSSGYSIDGQANAIMQRGCNGFIQKPFNMAELSKKIRGVLS